MYIIVIMNEKGGVGKTTLAGSIGSGLALKGYRVLLIDADGQGDLSTNMNMPKVGYFYDFVKRGDKNSPDYRPTKELCKKVPQDVCPDNLYIVPGNNESWGIPASTNLRQVVKNLTLRFAELRNSVDFVLIDTQPSATMLHEAIGLVTDYFICPTDAEPLSAYGGLRSTIEHIGNIREQLMQRGHDKAKLLGIIPNKYRMRTSLHQHVYEKLKELYGDKVWEPLPLRTAIPESQYFQTSLLYDAPELKTNDFIWSIVNRVAALKETTRE